MTGIDFSKLDDRNRARGMPIQPDSYHGPNLDGYGRRDTYAENMVATGYYRDLGCSLYPSCLACGLPDGCRYDVTASQSKSARNAKIRASKERGQHVDELARRFGVSTRSIHRIVQNGSGK